MQYSKTGGGASYNAAKPSGPAPVIDPTEEAKLNKNWEVERSEEAKARREWAEAHLQTQKTADTYRTSMSANQAGIRQRAAQQIAANSPMFGFGSGGAMLAGQSAAMGAAATEAGYMDEATRQLNTYEQEAKNAAVEEREGANAQEGVLSKEREQEMGAVMQSVVFERQRGDPVHARNWFYEQAAIHADPEMRKILRYWGDQLYAELGGT